MSVREAENDAKRLLEQLFGPTLPLPVDPFAIAQGLGIAVRFEWLPSDESGKIVIPANGSPVMTINAYDHRNRQRFTAAHEIGHYMRRRRPGASSTSTFVDYRATLAGLGQDVEEIYANQFAAALLMPAKIVVQFHNQGFGPDGMAEKFGTSVQAMDVRLRNLRLA